MDINPYEVLGVARDAGDRQIKSAHRRRAAATHPDKTGGDDAEFQRVQFAYELLSDPDRRRRFDATGRTDESKATPARVRVFLRSTMTSVIEATHKDGTTDDPTRDNILHKILMSMRASRTQLQAARIETQRKIGRAIAIKKRFVLKGGDEDPVGEILQADVDRLNAEMKTHNDAMELSEEAERIFRTYTYDLEVKVPGQAEGHFTRPETDRMTRTPLFLTGLAPFDGS